jgi:hypothetical protein
MIQWFAESAALLGALGSLASIISRFAAAREKKFMERTAHDFKAWAETDDGVYWWKGYHHRHLEDA